ncbi:FAD-dependent monooxygenase [Kutzneria buriramensis]|uniref:2-polyprenyl-6-methoxyphenol hydroxylase-like FAD-dependent oxidoreductase n=1 Tax=Kutzneria buriramensis TaxID=1045776 RepID=A0A3E0GVC7_9PSEU|nr:FAD-dependent monooxygenase [Kutzneria buriramensis]REH26449.1 2-polyprenyl-6-methoxyphenol hydroxylase-like FAD-dependent oxidoreductase [Kutzneria buriramensis]
MGRVLIIGGGVAGPAAALALRKAGLEPAVYEAYPVGGEDVGAFLTIMNNGMDALAAIDAAEAVEAVSFPATTVEFLDGAGRLLAKQHIAGQISTSHDPRTLRRSALYRALTEEAERRGIPVSHGKRLVDAVVDGDRVVAVFEDGSEAVGDVLIGADGIGSRVRSLIDPAAPTPRYTGLNVLYGYTDDPALPVSTDSYRMIQGKRAFFGYTTSPRGETFWFARLPGPELTRDQINGTTVDGWRRRAAEFFTADNTPSKRIIEATWEEIIGGNAYDVPSTPSWHRGPMVLVGDAAHAASPAAGQGASMALEDAVVLAQCLRDLPRDEAFEAYVRIRRERVERLVATSANDGATQQSEVLSEQLNDRQQSRAWLYGHHIDWAEPVA